LKEYEELRKARASSSFSPNFNTSGYDGEFSEISHFAEDDEMNLKPKTYWTFKSSNSFIKGLSVLTSIVAICEWV